MRKLLMVLSFLALPFLAACEDDATIASRNLSKAADNFEVVRNIVFYNVWTDTEVATVIGKCSIEVQQHKFVAVCKDGPGDFKKHYLGRSTNLSFFAVQLDGVNVSTFHTRITWKPQGFVPDIDFRGDAGAFLENPGEQ